MTALTDAEVEQVADEIGERLADRTKLQATFDRLNDAAGGGPVPWQAVAYTTLRRFYATRITSPASFKADDYSEGWQSKEQLAAINAQLARLLDQATAAGWEPDDETDTTGYLDRDPATSSWTR